MPVKFSHRIKPESNGNIEMTDPKTLHIRCQRIFFDPSDFIRPLSVPQPTTMKTTRRQRW